MPFVDNHFVILVGSYNNAQWVESNLNSVLVQDYKNYHVIYFDDASTDGTVELVNKMVENDNRFIVYPSMKRQYKTWFFSNVEHIFPINDNDIVIFLDGDDMLYCTNVLSYINEIYNQSNCWMTYGGMMVWNGGTDIVEPFPQNSEIPSRVLTQKEYRQDIWRTSHLKTMRGFLWKAFRKNELCPCGIYEPCQDDLAIMFAALEMCPPEKIYRVREPLYLYNSSPGNNGSRGCTELKGKQHLENIIRSYAHYKTIPIVSPTLAGGLGNQMFEIAAAASLAKDNGALLVVNPTEHILPNQGRNINVYTNNVFSRIVLDNHPPTNNHITIETLFYEPMAFKPNVKLRGNFQSYKYFDHNRNYIRDLFAPTLDIRNHIAKTYPAYKSRITAIQVRRGDYAKFPNHHPLLTPEYYAKAVKIVGSEIVWVFSDDIPWCKENLHFDCPSEYIKDEDYIEMYLMSLCKNIVIANSSFGWWAGYLKTTSGQVFAPHQWFGPALLSKGFKHDDLIPRDWTVINTCKE